MSTTIELTTELLDEECNYHDCEDDSEELWMGLSKVPDEGKIYHYLAEYCVDHSEEHAEEQPALRYVGEMESIAQ